VPADALSTRSSERRGRLYTWTVRGGRGERVPHGIGPDPNEFELRQEAAAEAARAAGAAAPAADLAVCAALGACVPGENADLRIEELE
jgi:hypothetical protein